MRAPVLAALFLIITLANLAMPGTANFMGEFYILIGVFQSKIVFAFVASIGVSSLPTTPSASSSGRCRTGGPRTPTRVRSASETRSSSGPSWPASSPWRCIRDSSSGEATRR